MTRIYALFDPREPVLVRYVGKTDWTLAARLTKHLWEAHNGFKSHRFHWIRGLLHAGIEPKIRLIEEVTAADWRERERFWIEHFRRDGHPMTNHANGGDGLDSGEWKRVWSDPERRRRQSVALRAYNARPDVIARKREEMRLRYASPDARRRHSDILKAASSSPAAREKKRRATIATWADPEIRRRRISGLQTFNTSAAYAQARSERSQRTWATRRSNP